MSLLIKAFTISLPSGVVGPSTPEFDGGRDDDWEFDPEPAASSPCPGCQFWGFGGYKRQNKENIIYRVSCTRVTVQNRRKAIDCFHKIKTKVKAGGVKSFNMQRFFFFSSDYEGVIDKIPTYNYIFSRRDNNSTSSNRGNSLSLLSREASESPLVLPVLGENR